MQDRDLLRDGRSAQPGEHSSSTLPVGKAYRRVGRIESRRHPGQYYLYSTRPGVSHWIFSECASLPQEVSLLKHDEEIGSLRCFSVAQVVLYIYIHTYIYISQSALIIGSVWGPQYVSDHEVFHRDNVFDNRSPFMKPP